MANCGTMTSQQQVLSGRIARLPIRGSLVAPCLHSQVQQFQGLRAISGVKVAQASQSSAARVQRGSALKVYAIKDGATLDRKLRVAVIGGGPGGACAADTLAQNGIEVTLFERKLDNCKVCANPCMLASYQYGGAVAFSMNDIYISY